MGYANLFRGEKWGEEAWLQNFSPLIFRQTLFGNALAHQTCFDSEAREPPSRCNSLDHGRVLENP